MERTTQPLQRDSQQYQGTSSLLPLTLCSLLPRSHCTKPLPQKEIKTIFKRLEGQNSRYGQVIKTPLLFILCMWLTLKISGVLIVWLCCHFDVIVLPPTPQPPAFADVSEHVPKPGKKVIQKDKVTGKVTCYFKILPPNLHTFSVWNIFWNWSKT